jgi:hypothetical protein
MHFGSPAKSQLTEAPTTVLPKSSNPPGIAENEGEGEKFMKLMKATLSRLWRLTGATSIAVSLAVVVALAGGVVSQAVAAPSGTTTAVAILKGVSNTANTVTTLVNTGTGEALRLEAKSTALRVEAKETDQPALKLIAPAGKPPLEINETAGKAINLEADKLDGKNADEFLGKREKALDSLKADEATHALKADEAIKAMMADEATKALKADEAAQAVNSEKLGGVVAMDYMLKEAKALDSFKADEAKHAANADNAANADKIDGKDSTDFFRNWQRVEGEMSGLNSAAPIKITAAHCPPGQMVLSGGYQIAGIEAGEVTVVNNNPTADGTAWFVVAEEIGAGTTVDWQVQAFAICADV